MANKGVTDGRSAGRGRQKTYLHNFGAIRGLFFPSLATKGVNSGEKNGNRMAEGRSLGKVGAAIQTEIFYAYKII
jgi:hypothetical protein